MSFSAVNAKLCLILRIDLPGHNVRLSEAGEVTYNGDVYAPIDSVLGVVSDFQNYTSGEADEAPAFDFTWAVKDIAAAVLLSAPTSQGAFVDWRILSINRDTNAVLSNHLIFTGLVDNTELSVDDGKFELRMGVATEIDRLLNTDKGNKLNRAFHQSVWPAETGLDMMTGTTTPVPWGDASRKTAGGGGGGQPRNPRIDFR